MTYDDALLLIGAVCILAMGMLWTRILVGHWWCRYGKQAGFAWAFLAAEFATARFAQYLGWGTPETRSQMASYTYIIAIVYMVDVVRAHIKLHEREER